MHILDSVPAAIRQIIGEQTYTPNTAGHSAAGVLMFDRMVLKTAPADPTAAREIQMMTWLQGRLPVPQVLHSCVENGRSFLLMSRLPGVMACDRHYMERPGVLIPLLARGLRRLWQVDVVGCPGRFGLEERLMLAEQLVREGKCDTEHVEPGTYGPDGFRDPAHLLRWLKDHRPPVDPVLSHGDFCLPNLFLRQDRVSGYLDLGFCAVADRYQDIALCWRSLAHNSDGSYGAAYPGIRPDALFDALGITPDREKVRYYILLDELF